MNDQFTLCFDTMPKGTSQQKGVQIRNGKVHYYKKGNVAGAEAEFMAQLIPHRPKQPSDKPIALEVRFAFDTKDKKKWGAYKPTRPDTDNYIKLFKDCMTKAGYWLDDAQVVDEHIVKTYAERATIGVIWEEVNT